MKRRLNEIEFFLLTYLGRIKMIDEKMYMQQWKEPPIPTCKWCGKMLLAGVENFCNDGCRKNGIIWHRE